MTTTYDEPHFPDGARGCLLRPGHLLGDRIVIACQTWCDNDGRDEQEVIRLMLTAPFFEVALWDFSGPTPKRYDAERFYNIVEAVDYYSD